VSLVRNISNRTKVLSGGNQQKVVLGKWLAAAPRVLLCDEPTRGIDVSARADLYRLLIDLAESGVAIVIASSDLDEVLTVTSRVLVMSHGRVVAEFDTESTTERELMRAATETRPMQEPASPAQ
jgi:ribose transport system ATP-binding protein